LFSVSTLHDALAFEPLKKKFTRVNLESDSLPCPTPCLNCSFEQQEGSGVVFAVREFIAVLIWKVFRY
jgi:hypothetical protein